MNTSVANLLQYDTSKKCKYIYFWTHRRTRRGSVGAVTPTALQKLWQLGKCLRIFRVRKAQQNNSGQFLGTETKRKTWERGRSLAIFRFGTYGWRLIHFVLKTVEMHFAQNTGVKIESNFSGQRLSVKNSYAHGYILWH